MVENTFLNGETIRLDGGIKNATQVDGNINRLFNFSIEGIHYCLGYHCPFVNGNWQF